MYLHRRTMQSFHFGLPCAPQESFGLVVVVLSFAALKGEKERKW